ncbi:hypothetical protein PBPRA3324 [Photobacterium profundum SS9]|uniref:Uncharacterized protein n=1 Tax=Photobacterium profundum (strain SS9) TaxID=298386 RepID=Q6LM55_PHOPR|nr:hypothetical protein PBPRA3324 [Photobacterium profundum SS9]
MAKPAATASNTPIILTPVKTSTNEKAIKNKNSIIFIPLYYLHITIAQSKPLFELEHKSLHFSMIQKKRNLSLRLRFLSLVKITIYYG